MMKNVWCAGVCALVCAGLVACGDDDEEQPVGQAGSTQDGGLDGAAGSTGGDGGGGGTGGTGGVDDAGTGGTAGGTGGTAGGDAGLPPAPPAPTSNECDIMAQDCADDVNTKCTVYATSPAYSWCVPVWGDQPVGESCTRPTNAVGLDTCEAGAYCGNFTQPSPQERVCWALCAGAGDCSSGENCFQLGSGTAMGVCIPGCDPFGTDCNSANQCTWALDTEGATSFWCAFVGTAQEGQSCGASQACADGLWCATLPSGAVECVPKCDDDHPCSAEAICYSVVDEAPHTGVCFRADWSCLGGAPWPDPVASEVDVEFTVLDYAQGTADPVENATIKVCAANDPICASPLGTQTTGTAGTATITVQVGTTGFDGYFEVTAQDRVPILRTFNRPLTAENYAPLTFGVGDEAAYQGAYAPSGVTIDFTRGQVEAIMYDCAGVAAPGVEMDATGLDASSTIAYLGNDGTVDESLVQTALYGMGMILNVPGTTTTVTATRGSNSTTIAEATIPIRAGVITEIRLVPEP